MKRKKVLLPWMVVLFLAALITSEKTGLKAVIDGAVGAKPVVASR